MKRGGLDNGNHIIWWDVNLAGARTVSGFCEANPLTGRIVGLGTDLMDSRGGIRGTGSRRLMPSGSVSEWRERDSAQATVCLMPLSCGTCRPSQPTRSNGDTIPWIARFGKAAATLTHPQVASSNFTRIAAGDNRSTHNGKS